MANSTNIEWCDSTFNPFIGCQAVSPGCDNCYAKKWVERFGGDFSVRRRTSRANWALPVKWEKLAGVMQSAWEDGVALHGGDEAACIAAGFIKPQRPKVFCASLADVFDNAVDPMWRADLFWLIKQTPNLDWLLLTKCIGNAKTMMADAIATIDPMAEWVMPLPNVWIGATIVNQEEADRDIPKLLSVPAAKRFLSMEPLLGPVDLYKFFGCALLDWVIVGGESGPGARPMHPCWARSLRDQCEAAGVPFLFKQWGEFAPNWFNDDANQKIPGSEWIERMGKKIAGRLLDGITHDGVPS